MAWIKVYGEIWESWKIPAMCESLKIGEAQAVGHLVSLWCFTERNAWRDGDLSRWGATGIARAAKWDGEPAEFVSALQGASFLQGMVVHEWKVHQAGMIHDRERRMPAKPLAAAADNPREIPAKSPPNTGLDKIREEKRREEKKQTPSPAAIEGEKKASQYPKEFLKFWAAYPRKSGKKDALKSWKKSTPPLDKCLRTLSLLVQTDQWKREDGRFIPHPATWLNQGRWDDVPEGYKEFTCNSCGYVGKVRSGYTGSAKCPECKNSTEVGG